MRSSLHRFKKVIRRCLKHEESILINYSRRNPFRHHGGPPEAFLFFGRLRVLSSAASGSPSKQSQYASQDAQFWKNATNRREYILWLQSELQLPSIPSLTKINLSKLQKYGGQGVLDSYGGCWVSALADTFPELAWRLDPHKRSQITQSIQRNYWMGLLRSLNQSGSLEQLYGITYNDVIESGGRPVLQSTKSNGLISESIVSAFPEHHWDPFKFVSGAPSATWNDSRMKRQYLDYLSKEKLGLDDLSGWYRVSIREFRSKGGANAEALLALHDGDLAQLLANVYQDHNWIPWMFSQVPAGFWNDEKNVSDYFDWLGKRLGVEKMEDWYKLSKQHLASNAGGGLLRKRFRDSIALALQTVYPGHEWQPWRFQNAPQGFWEQLPNQRRFLDWCFKRLELKSMNDWKSVSIQQIVSLGGHALIKNQHTGSLRRALEAAYPEHQWNWIR